MKFKVEKKVFSEAISWATRSLPSHPAMPILSGVRIEARGEGSVLLSIFDYEISARCEIPAEVSVAGEVVVSGRLLADIARMLPEKTITLELDGSKVSVSCGSTRYQLGSMPVGEYPSLPSLPELAGTVSIQEFNDAVRQVTIAASKDETTQLLTGVNITFDGDTITMAATDRYRLSKRVLNWSPVKTDIQTSVLVRAKIISDLAKSMGSAGTLQISFSDDDTSNIIGFEGAGRQSTSVLLNGEYPSIKKLFPTELPTYVVTKTQDLYDAVKRVSLIAERSTFTRLSITEGQIVIEAIRGEEAAASEVVQANLVGEDIMTAFNHQYLLEGLAAISQEYVRLSFEAPSKPSLINGQEKADSDKDTRFEYLLMPRRSVV